MGGDKFDDAWSYSDLRGLVHLKKHPHPKKTMGNDTNMENWAARERLRWIERSVWWRGWVGRPDLAAMFGISSAQASSDLQRYQDLNPGALAYHLGRKRYEGTEGMLCVLHEPSLVEAMNVFLGGAGVMTGPAGAVGGSAKVDVVQAPRRKVLAEVERKLFLAVFGGLALEVKYHSVRSGKVGKRKIVPRAFGHDGLRWHVRAWCEEAAGWRDFVLGRISWAGWPGAVKEDPPEDEDWETMVTLRFRVSGKLSEAAQANLRLDYGIGKDGILKVKCRRAMQQYVEAWLRVPPAGTGLPEHFERMENPS